MAFRRSHFWELPKRWISHIFSVILGICGPVYCRWLGAEWECCRFPCDRWPPASPLTPLLCPVALHFINAPGSPPLHHPPLPVSQRGSRWCGSRGVCHANLPGSYPPSPSSPAYADCGLLPSYFGPEGGKMLGVPGWAWDSF